MQSRNKVMQVWDRDAVRFMQDASEFGNYHEKLSEILLPYLPLDGHVCDAGCGLGYLALHLSEYCREVTAVDQSASAIEALMAKEDLPENLHVFCRDIHSMRASYDAMIFCYFGRTKEILQISRQQCRGKVVILKRNCAEHRFSVGRLPLKHTAGTTLQELDELGIPYESRSIELEFGQPFRCESDAIRFFELYNKNKLPIQKEEVLTQLVPLNQAEFPVYLPARRKMELIVFEAADIPEGKL